MRIKDSITSAVSARFTPAIGNSGGDEDASEEEAASSTTSVIFRQGMRFGAKKTVAFRTNETLIQVDLFATETGEFLASYNITGFGVLNKHKPQVGLPKVHISFRLSSSGLPELEVAEAEVVTLVVPSPPPSRSPSPSPSPSDAPDATADAAAAGAESTEPATLTESATAPESETEALKPKRKTHREPLRVIRTKSGRMSLAQQRKSEQVLRALEKRDTELFAFFDAKNSLEAYVYKLREMVDYDDDTKTYAQAAEKEAALAAADVAESWLSSEDGEAAEERRDTAVFVKQLRTLTDISDKWAERKSEAGLRFDAVAKLLRKLNTTATSLVNITLTKNVTEVEEAQALRQINELQSWVVARMAEQQKL